MADGSLVLGLSDLNLRSRDGNLEVLNMLHASQAESLVDSLHAETIGLGNTSLGAAEKHIELLECLVFSLWGEEPDEKTTQAAENGEEDVSAVFHRVEHIFRGQSNNEVEEPIGLIVSKYPEVVIARGKTLTSWLRQQ